MMKFYKVLGLVFSLSCTTEALSLQEVEKEASQESPSSKHVMPSDQLFNRKLAARVKNNLEKIKNYLDDMTELANKALSDKISANDATLFNKKISDLGRQINDIKVDANLNVLFKIKPEVTTCKSSMLEELGVSWEVHPNIPHGPYEIEILQATDDIRLYGNNYVGVVNLKKPGENCGGDCNWLSLEGLKEVLIIDNNNSKSVVGKIKIKDPNKLIGNNKMMVNKVQVFGEGSIGEILENSLDRNNNITIVDFSGNITDIEALSVYGKFEEKDPKKCIFTMVAKDNAKFVANNIDLSEKGEKLVTMIRETNSDDSLTVKLHVDQGFNGKEEIILTLNQIRNTFFLSKEIMQEEKSYQEVCVNSRGVANIHVEPNTSAQLGVNQLDVLTHATAQDTIDKINKAINIIDNLEQPKSPSILISRLAENIGGVNIVSKDCVPFV